MDVKNVLTGVFDRLCGLRNERPMAGTKYRLMGVVADIMEVTENLSEEVLERVKQEAVLDADVDTDYDAKSVEVLSWELEMTDVNLQEATQQVNDALGALSDVLMQIGSQLERRHKDEEYVRLYEQEKRRYLSSGTPRRVRRTFDEWLYDVCNGAPSMEAITDYVTEKLVHMFEKGVFDARVEHIQRATRYPAEFDFSLLDDDHKLKKTVHKHYSELRKLVDYRDGVLVVNPVKVGRHFYTSRKGENARAHRNAFLKYMHKIALAQEERRKLLETEASKQVNAESEPNRFAPKKHLQVLLNGTWFAEVRTDEKYDAQWTDCFIQDLMDSEYGEGIARDWAVKGAREKKNLLRSYIVGLLKDAGVLKGSYSSIALKIDPNDRKRTLATNMSRGKNQPYAEWVKEYVEGR